MSSYDMHYDGNNDAGGPATDVIQPSVYMDNNSTTNGGNYRRERFEWRTNTPVIARPSASAVPRHLITRYL